MILFLLDKKSYAVKRGNKNKSLIVLETLIEQYEIKDYKIKYYEDDNINDINANIIVPMGTEVTKKLLHFDKGINKARLRYYRSEEHNAYVLPTFDPGYIFTHNEAFIDLQQDFERLKTIGRKFELDPEYYIFEDPKYCVDCIRTLNNNYDLLACDIESSGLSWQDDWITELGITYEVNKSLIIPNDLLENEIVQEALADLFNNKDIDFLWQNGKFDSKFLKYIYNYNVRQDQDTILQHYTLDERKGTHSFTRLTQLYINAENYEDEFKELIPASGSYADAPADARRKYLSKDTSYLLILHKLFNDLMDDDDRYLYKNVLIPASNMLIDVEMNGIKIDREQINVLDKRMTAEIKEFRSEIADIVDEAGWNPEGYIIRTDAKTRPEEFNPNAYPQLFDLMFNIFKVEKHNGRSSTDEKARNYWVNKVLAEDSLAYKFVEKLSEFKKVKKMHSTYVKGFKKHIRSDGRVYSIFLLYGTVTGRLSSKDPNIQNIPRDKEIKNLFTVEEGHTLMEIDYSQAELRTIAYLSGDEFMKDIYRRGSDLHDEVAKEFFGPDFTPEQRTFVKSINFGIPYGISAYSLAEDLDILEKEAQKYIEKWFQEKPQVKKFITKYKAKPAKGEPLETPFGRKRRFGAITSKNKWFVQREAINFPVQSVASDLTLLSAVRLNPKVKGLAKIVNLVHDSIVMEVPEENIEKVAQIAKNTMEETPKLYLDNLDIPFIADVEVGKSWGKMKAFNIEK
jgi:DNA polymerase-1